MRIFYLSCTMAHMGLTVLSKVRNAADIIESFIRHHAPFTDRFIVVDHRSRDDTPSILRRLHAEGFPIDLRTDDRTEHDHGGVMTRLIDELRADPPTWTALLDSDEFIVGSEHLATGSTDAVSLLPWRCYVPLLDDDPMTPLPHRLTHRRSMEPAQFFKVLIPGTLLREIALVEEGNHHVRDARGELLRSIIRTDMHLAHFPVRTPEQIRKKVITHWESRLANPSYEKGQSFHLQALYERCKHDSHPITPEELKDMALRYAVPPDMDIADLTTVEEPLMAH